MSSNHTPISASNKRKSSENATSSSSTSANGTAAASVTITQRRTTRSHEPEAPESTVELQATKLPTGTTVSGPSNDDLSDSTDNVRITRGHASSQSVNLTPTPIIPPSILVKSREMRALTKSVFSTPTTSISQDEPMASGTTVAAATTSPIPIPIKQTATSKSASPLIKSPQLTPTPASKSPSLKSTPILPSHSASSTPTATTTADLASSSEITPPSVTNLPQPRELSLQEKKSLQTAKAREAALATRKANAIAQAEMKARRAERIAQRRAERLARPASSAAQADRKTKAAAAAATARATRQDRTENGTNSKRPTKQPHSFTSSSSSSSSSELSDASSQSASNNDDDDEDDDSNEEDGEDDDSDAKKRRRPKRLGRWVGTGRLGRRWVKAADEPNRPDEEDEEDDEDEEDEQDEDQNTRKKTRSSSKKDASSSSSSSESETTSDKRRRRSSSQSTRRGRSSRSKDESLDGGGEDDEDFDPAPPKKKRRRSTASTAAAATGQDQKDEGESDEDDDHPMKPVIEEDEDHHQPREPIQRPQPTRKKRRRGRGILTLKKAVKSTASSYHGLHEDDSDGDHHGSSQRTSVPRYKCVNRIKEGHGQPLYFVSFNTIDARHADIFASAGANRVTVYRALPNGPVDPLQLYVDEDPNEMVYSLAWSIDIKTGASLLLIAGQNGIIKIIDLHLRRIIRKLVGHGSSVNELKIHPLDPHILLSVSKDMSVRIWNLLTGDLIAIFAGDEGHRDEVLSGDFHSSGDRIVSSGMDHSIMIWELTDQIKQVIKYSYLPAHERTLAPFPTVFIQYPSFSTNSIHSNYVDHCKYFGDFILSKSTEEKIIMWKSPQRLLEYSFTDCDIWYIRFALDHPNLNYLCVGNKSGTLFLWNMSTYPVQSPRRLVTPQSQRAIRCVAFNQDASILLSACEDGTIFRWDQYHTAK